MNTYSEVAAWLRAANEADTMEEFMRNCAQKAKVGQRQYFRTKAETCSELAEKFRRNAFLTGVKIKNNADATKTNTPPNKKISIVQGNYGQAIFLDGKLLHYVHENDGHLDVEYHGPLFEKLGYSLAYEANPSLDMIGKIAQCEN